MVFTVDITEYYLFQQQKAKHCIIRTVEFYVTSMIVYFNFCVIIYKSYTKLSYIIFFRFKNKCDYVGYCLLKLQ